MRRWEGERRGWEQRDGFRQEKTFPPGGCGWLCHFVPAHTGQGWVTAAVMGALPECHPGKRRSWCWKSWVLPWLTGCWEGRGESSLNSWMYGTCSPVLVAVSEAKGEQCCWGLTILWSAPAWLLCSAQGNTLYYSRGTIRAHPQSCWLGGCSSLLSLNLSPQCSFQAKSL